jgi:hypothetical protein
MLLSLAMLLCASLAWAQSAPQGAVKIIKVKKFDVSPPLRELVKNAKPGIPAVSAGRQDREIPNKLEVRKRGESNKRDAVLQASGAGTEAANITLNFDGASNTDNQNVVGFRVAPPDPNMDVGPNHIVQTINLITTMYNKSGGVVLGPFATDDLWAGFGGDCELNNDGDPVVLYDHLADRWVISQFVFSVSECVCVSQTPDPTGAYFRYEFSTPGNDYPKLGVMEDAYYATIRNFSGAFNIDAAAMDRAKMLAGDPGATIQIFDLSALNPDVEGFLPADLDGPAPPAGTPGMIVGHNGGPTLVHNELEVYNFDVDFFNPGNSSLTLADAIPVSQYDISITTIPQPSPGPGLDDLAIFTMHRVGLRNMGSHLAMVLNHTVDVNNPANHAGIRWYELRDNTSSGNNWTLFQEGTFAPDAAHRWMGAIAMNANGDIGLSYTVSSSSIFPSIRVTGRLATDPLGTMMAETPIIAGTGAQTGTGRWGDYSSLSVDPSDNIKFAGTHEYGKTTGSFNWWTRIFSFQVTPAPPGCTNIALNRPATASSTQGSNVASRAVDDNTATFWRSASGGTQWLRVDVGTGVNYGGGEIVWNGNRHATSYSIQVSNNSGGPWTTVFSTTTGDGGTDTFTFATRTERYCRILMTVPNANHYRVAEFRVCAASGASKLTAGDLDALAVDAPREFTLHQNYPNPFNPTTRIHYQIPADMRVSLKVYNMMGEEVRTLVDRHHNAGSYEVDWNALQDSGARVPSGVYFYRLQGEGISEVKKMILLQ